MKNQFKIAFAVACAAVTIFAGCAQAETGLTLDAVREAYGTVSQATKIEESIEIKSGSLVQYTEEREYSLSGDTYTVTGSTKKLNDLSAQTAYTEAEIETYTVNKTEAFSGALGLEDANVESVKAEETALTVFVKANREKDFLKLQALTDVSAMQAVFEMNEAVLGGIVVTYDSGDSSVTVTISFTY